jgi:OOP family OmpA-OmpF porin
MAASIRCLTASAVVPDPSGRRLKKLVLMTVFRKISPVVLALLVMTVVSTPSVSRAGLGDKLKKKAGDTANKAADDALNKAAPTKTTTGESTAPPADGNAAAPETASGSGDIASVSTKFDFVPGDRVLFFDDFTRDELGEFPANWKLRTGTFEVAERNGERWMRCTSSDSDIRMKLPPMPELPEYWTLELDFFCDQPSGNVLTVTGLHDETMVWNAVFPMSGRNLAFTTGEIFSNTPLDGPDVWGRVHHVMFMARGPALKVYVDRQRLANVPEINPEPGAPNGFSFRLWSDRQPMITNVRFAEGNKPVADPFADGKLVTYGIYFDSGSDVVQAESAPVLRQIAAYMEKSPAVKVEITGHTDNQGKEDENLDLSKRRAAAVAKVLSDQFKIAADRFKTDGMGDTRPVSDNARAEGRAMNRRVEFTKL